MAKFRFNLSVSQAELFYIIESLDLYEDYMVSHYLKSPILFDDDHVDSDLKGRLLEQRKFRCRCFDFLKKHFGFGLPD